MMKRKVISSGLMIVMLVNLGAFDQDFGELSRAALAGAFDATQSRAFALSKEKTDIDAAMAHLSDGSGGKTPTVKHFEKAWVRSLTQRGEPTVYTRKNSSNFEYIGMPIGGIAAGQLYLGGDGQLWFWDIFNTNRKIGDLKGQEAYQYPYRRSRPEEKGIVNIEQGFAVRVRWDDGDEIRTLNRGGFARIGFKGQYPIGYVTYSEEEVPIRVELEAFAPFIPLNLEDSIYPATILNYKLTNLRDEPVEAEVAGWLENALCLETRKGGDGILENRVLGREGMTILECRAKQDTGRGRPRPDILFEDFESGGYEGWTVEGTTFGKAPKPNYHHQLLSGYEGRYLADSFHNDGDRAATSTNSDSHTGKLVSGAFTINRRRIAFRIGGGSHVGRTCLNLVIDGDVVDSAMGSNSETLSQRAFDVSKYQGKQAYLEIVDSHSGGWGHVLVDEIIFTDKGSRISDRYDYGSLCLGVLGSPEKAVGCARVQLPDALFEAGASKVAEEPFSGGKLIGSVGRKLRLGPKSSEVVTFILAWHFPNSRVRSGKGRYYATQFDSATAVAEHLKKNFGPLAGNTRLWRQTWYDSTLPYWFLDRTFLNASILASSTCHLFEDGRFYGFEGGYQGPGTCTHVWGYVQAMGRLFPELERKLREHTDFKPFPGGGFHPDSGLVEFRGRFGHGLAVDGQSGLIHRCLLVHQMSKDKQWLKKSWPAIKKAMNYLIEARDADHDGILTGPQHNTLDANWYGKITWLSLHYDSALLAAAQMAEETGDQKFAEHCRTLSAAGRKYIEDKLFNGEYFIQEPDPNHPKSPGVFNGCEYSQLLGQSWAYQVGLGEILDAGKVTTTLKSLWKYNFSTDVGPFREVFKAGRWYAMPGEGGLIACTWPRGGQEVLKHGSQHFAGYLNECQDGYEYGATSLMMWHGLVYQALAHTRTLHDRYHGSKRNPWNEVEWGCHYSRSMASYGLFTGICGFEYHGPKGYIAFSPRLRPENFRAAFTSAQGWGTFSQTRNGKAQTEKIEVKWGKLRLKSLAFDLPAGTRAKNVKVTISGKKLDANHRTKGERVTITLNEPAVISTDQSLVITIGL